MRFVVGRPTSSATGAAGAHDVDIVLPRSVETVSDREVFAADEAADMFERFYRTDAIGDGYILRAVEGYTADGGYFRIPSR